MSIKTFFIGVTLCALIGCADETGTAVNIQNNAQDRVTVKKIEVPQDLAVDAGTSATVTVYSYAETFQLEFEYRGSIYAGETGYVQDSASMRIELFDELGCTVTTAGSPKTVPLTKRD